VVADSNGTYEYNESRNKARAVLNAIAAAETLTIPGAPGAGEASGRSRSG
jgi:anthranilate synthase component 1